jgi:hypothetical protein
MAIEIGTVNADTSVKLGTTIIQSGYIGYNNFYGTEFKILDLFPSAHHAYSLRKLRTAYTGSCLRIRRTTSTPTVTTTTVDLAFDSNGTISLNSAITYVSGTVTLSTNLGQFCASVVNGYSNPDLVNTNQNIFVVTWFDQSGNSKNPTQGTAGLQPKIVNVGNLETSGGKVTVRFTKASSTRLNIADTTANINNMSSYYVGAFANTVSGQIGYTISGSGSTSMFYFPYLATNISAGYGASLNAIQLDTGTTTDRRLYELLAPSPLNSAVVQGWSNGIDKGTFALASGASNTIQLGARGTSLFLDGYIQEVIGWQTNANRLEKEININNYWTIY